MREIEILLSSGIDCRKVEQAIDAAVAQASLLVTLRDTLKKFPGCIHWHIKNGDEPGTLEITLWPNKERAWFTIQDGRRAPWIEKKLKFLRQQILEKLAGG